MLRYRLPPLFTFVLSPAGGHSLVGIVKQRADTEPRPVDKNVRKAGHLPARIPGSNLSSCPAIGRGGRSSGRSGGARRGGFGGSAEGWLTLLRCIRAYPVGPHSVRPLRRVVGGRAPSNPQIRIKSLMEVSRHSPRKQ